MMPGVPVGSGLVARLRSLWRGLRHRGDVEAEMTEEFRHHLALLTEDLVRRGLPPEEAARRARVEFGHVGSHREDARAARGLARFDELRVSWLDVKLGLRMLRKYPGLSVVSVIGMSVAIAVGAGYFGVLGAFLDPTLPLHEGERVVAIRNVVATDPDEDRQTLRDLVAWRAELTTVRELAAFTPVQRNLLVPGRSVELVELAQMTASGFRVARVAPLLGRPLVPGDEREGAPPVVVIAHDEWQRVFGGDPGILGRPVRLGSDVHTIVGVMPPGFHFPVNHRYWVPLPQRLADVERGDGPNLFVFGRLADGATLDAAQAELAVVGARMARAHPETHEHLRPRVSSYTRPIVGIEDPAMETAARGMQLAVGLLLVLVAANVAILVYARVATRTGEIAVRTALGASRKRVITQLFVEAFVLSALSAAIGLTITGVAFEVLWRYHETNADWMWPFWIRLGLTPGLVAYVAGLAILAGVIVGVVPALKATGRRVQAGLQQLSTRGSQQQLGRTWTALIVVQVAIAVAVLPSAIHVAGRSALRGLADPGYPADEILRATLSMEPEHPLPDVPPDSAARVFERRMRDRVAELIRRLEAEPAVAGVTVATDLPGREPFVRVEADGAGAPAGAGTASAAADPPPVWARTNWVDPRFFAVFDFPTLAGRTFVDGDARVGSTAVVVDQAFVDRFLRGGPALGRRVRLLHPRDGGAPDELDPGPWLEVVGVVPHYTAPSSFGPPSPVLYQPASLTEKAPARPRLGVRVRSGSASSFVPRLRDLAAGVDPALQFDELRTAADFEREDRQALLFLAIGITAVTASVLLLSATGIYAMMSFTVARRRREIGIRAALGADRRRLLAGVFARASGQLGAGVLSGLVLAAVVDRAANVAPLEGRGVIVFPAVALLMMAVGLLAAFGPARRGLAVQPTEALRAE